MKRLFAIVLCIMMVGSVFAMAISADAEEADNAPAGVASDVVDQGAVADPTQGDVIMQDNTDNIVETSTEDVTDSGETVIPSETVVAPTGETTVETIISSEPTTATEATEPATEASKDQVKPADKKPSPKTGENAWLWIGIGVFGVALVALIITFVVKKKAK